MNQLQADLAAMRTLLADPAKWTTGYYARDLAGGAVWPLSPAAECFCVMGAARRVTKDDPGRVCAVRLFLIEELGMAPGPFNDSPTTSHKNVLTALAHAYDHAGLINS